MSAAPLRIALPKGRMLDDALGLWERIGAEVPQAERESRRLVLASLDGRFEFLPVKPQDVGTYVEAGVADAGVVGWDVLEEWQPDVLRPPERLTLTCQAARRRGWRPSTWRPRGGSSPSAASNRS